MNKTELLSQLSEAELQSLMAAALRDMVKKEWLTPDELEKEYGISINAQNRMRMERRIPYSKIGKYVRYKRTDIERWLEEHKIETAAGL
ncbi:helix-turn-helix domain-containing protein [Lebetimonas natsushimae]|nr:helix-turn-helix domain-containing protein [Lebetimonas natsushimae]